MTMEILTERLEIRVDSSTMRQLRSLADRRGVSIGRVVRDALGHELGDDRAERLRAAEALFAVGASVADWPVMEDEIEAARSAEPA
jgi:hypothetical protein